MALPASLECSQIIHLDHKTKDEGGGMHSSTPNTGYRDPLDSGAMHCGLSIWPNTWL